MNPYLTAETMTYLDNHYYEMLDLLKELCLIPAPSHKEDLRAEFCKNWLEKQGAKGVYIDEAKNVVFPFGCENAEKINVVMAHMDTVFPDMEPLPYRFEDGKIYCPGVGDDTANLVVMLMCVKYILETGLTPKDNKGYLFVCNSCEEGLGNLKGSRQIVKDYGDKIEGMASFDGYYGFVVNDAVGSTRYKVEVLTEGGHSYANFGNKNAIAVLSSLVCELYKINVPTNGHTTYNVGVINGGTSVNTIAQQADMLFEYRSDSREDLQIMKETFDGIVEKFTAEGNDIQVTVLGQRPCKGDVDDEALASLTKKAVDLNSYYTGGKKIFVGPSSTDCNTTLSAGIPSVCFGTCLGGGAHTRGEWMLADSLKTGLKLGASWILQYFE